MEVVDYTFLALNMDRSLVKHSERHGRTVHCMLEPTFVSIAPPATVRISQSRRRVCGLRGVSLGGSGTNAVRNFEH